MACSDSESLLSVAVIKYHCLHQYAPAYSCEKISASAPHQGGESSLFYAQGLAATDFALCYDHYLQ